jgi:two-component system NtrC family sensor kinase
MKQSEALSESESAAVLQKREEPSQLERALLASNQLLQALTEVQTGFIHGRPTSQLFDTLLSILLKLTGSEYGFIGEVRRNPEGQPYLKTHAITNVAWTQELRQFYAREAPRGLEFHNLKTLFGAVLTTGQPVVSNSPSTDPRRVGIPDGHPPLRAFLGLPFHANQEMIGMVGVANRAGGYDEAIIEFLGPFLATCSSLLVGLRSEQQRRRAEQEVWRSEANFRALIEQSPDAILIHRKGKVVFANTTAVKLLGAFDREELQGQPIASLVQPGQEQALTQLSSASAPLEVRFLHREGGQILAEVVTVLLEFYGEPSTVCLARDITERRQMQERFLLNERMASLGAMAAGVAHEFNTPLTYMVSNLNYVSEELHALAKAGKDLSGDHGQEILDALGETLVGSNRVRDIVSNLKLFSRVDNEKHGLVQLPLLLDSCVKMAWSEIKHRARLVKNYGPVPAVQANESRLGQVFLNLIVNAAQALPEEGGDSAEIRISMWHEEGSVVVSVQDTGKGIPEEHLSKVFDPFFTTKSVGVGTGLGLSICHGIITALGGRITVESKVGRGTTFQVFLPTAVPPPAEEERRGRDQGVNSYSPPG